MQHFTINHKNRYLATLMVFGLPSMAVASPTNNPPLTLNHLAGVQQDCSVTNHSVDSLGKAVTCGTVSGAVKTAYYSLNNAYFGGKSQDTVATGGYIRYETTPFYGVQAAVGYNVQRRLDDDNGHAEVSEFKNDKDGLGEAYLKWQNDNARVTVGNQRLDVPFLGDYSEFRILQNLYQAADVKLGNNDDFIRATKVNKFKSYGEDEFYKTSRQSAVKETDGMWSVGAGKSYKLANGNQLKGQVWYEDYDDYTKLAYAQGNYALANHPLKPEFAVQYITGKDQGKALAGNVDSQMYGAMLSLKPTSNATVKLAYDRIQPQSDAYRNGALLTPYSTNTSSSVIFAQPFFTSTQDLGAGNAYMIGVDGKYDDQTNLGARLSYMDLKESKNVDSRDQTELMVYGIHNFSGKLKGLSISNFAGIQHSPRYEGKENFFQNRLTVSLKF